MQRFLSFVELEFIAPQRKHSFISEVSNVPTDTYPVQKCLGVEVAKLCTRIRKSVTKMFHAAKHFIIHDPKLCLPPIPHSENTKSKAAHKVVI